MLIFGAHIYLWLGIYGLDGMEMRKGIYRGAAPFRGAKRYSYSAGVAYFALGDDDGERQP